MSCAPCLPCVPPQQCGIENFGLAFPSLVGPAGPPGSTVLFAANYAAARALNMTSVLAGTVVDVAGRLTNGDGGEGEFYYAPTSAAADNDGTILDPVGPGRIIRKYVGPMSAAWFGATGNGTTTETAALQATFNSAAANSDVLIPPGNYLTGALTISNGIHLIADQATLKANANGINVLTINYNSFQQGTPLRISGLGINGNGKTGVSGFFQTAITDANISFDHTLVESCTTGYNLRNGIQFCTFFRSRSTSCDVGMYVKARTVEGGGNSNSFYDLQVTNCIVGVIFNGGGYPFPLGADVLRNATILGSSVCGLACFNANLTLDGSANETNGLAGGTLVYDGLTVKASSIYLNSATLYYINSANTETDATNPAIIIENFSTLYLENVHGYGGTAAQFVSCSANSKVSVGPGVVTNGTIQGVINGPLMSNPSIGWASLMMTPISCLLDNTVPNEVSTPQLGPFDTCGVGATPSIVHDAVLGECRQVVFNNTISNGNLNTSAWNPTCAGTGFRIVALNIMSSVDCSMVVADFTNNGRQVAFFKAGVYYRLVWVSLNCVAGAQSFGIFTADTSAPTFKFSNWEVFSGGDTAATRGIMSRITAGAYNPKIKAVFPNREGAAAPVDGTWIVGDIVWHATPASGGNIGWVCTTAGTPGTWKAWGTIA